MPKMLQINAVPNKNEFSAIILSELKEFGVKCRKEKKPKAVEERATHKRIFRTHLHLLELADVFVASGNVVQIPRFVADACNRVLEQVDTEGIFRKAGSTIRQKEIRISLEAGLPLGKTHHVIDVANAIKYFFRELPEPLISCSLQDTLLRCLLVGQHAVKAILLTCLLLPPLTLNTMSFFMQFLRTISLSAHTNKMSAENLAIIFTPALMPFSSDINTQRFNNHVRVVQLLIEHANSIGIIPDRIVDKLQINEVLPNPPVADGCDVAQKRKKKRRSDMFNGLRKIVGSALGSSENLENTPEGKIVVDTATHNLATNQQPAGTPCLKSAKKRKFTEPVCAFSAKKKRDLLALLPSNSGGLLPNTPLTKPMKKSRLSLGGNRHTKTTATTANPVPLLQPVASMERRWSIVGTGWPKRNKNPAEAKVQHQSFESIQDMDEREQSGRNVTPYQLKRSNVELEFATPNDVSFIRSATTSAANKTGESVDNELSSDAESVRISKNEYEAIKERVAAIETRISQEFGSLCKSLTSADDGTYSLSGLERVLNKYDQMVVETEALTSPGTEQLAQRLSRGLKIRRSVDQQVIRSPSARKIGTLRRRSQDKKRLSRNPTWHISSSAASRFDVPALVQQQLKPHGIVPMPPACFYAKSNLKRGRPNTVQTGLQQQQYTPIAENSWKVEPIITDFGPDEHWTAGELFFKDAERASRPSSTQPPTLRSNAKVKSSLSAGKQIDFDACTPLKGKRDESSVCITPMLPPKSVPRKVGALRTPASAAASKGAAATRTSQAVRGSSAQTTPIGNDDVNGRASIARLRSQNAGMVMAKARLFDGLGGSSAAAQRAGGAGCHSASTDLHKDERTKCGRTRIAATANANAIVSITPNPMTANMPHTHTPTSEKCRTPLRKCAAFVKHSTIDAATEMASPCVGGRRKATVNAICKSPGSITKRRRLSIPAKLPARHVISTMLRDEALFELCDEPRPSLANRLQLKSQFNEHHKDTVAGGAVSSPRIHKNINWKFS